MRIRLHPVGMLTDAHNWLQYFLLASIVLNKDKAKVHPLWVDFFFDGCGDSKGRKENMPAAP